jgi:N-acetylglutamate synthase-like GNAT family acetyltransferase
VTEPGFRPLTATDPSFPAMVRLLDSAKMPTTDLWEGEPEYFIFGDYDAFGGIALYPPVALIRSVVVNIAYRRRSIGAAMVAHLERAARRRGIKEVWLMTTSAAHFFEGCGFKTAERTQAPEQIAQTLQFKDLCPASATLMRKRLS